MSTRIIIADDHKIMREGLRALIEKESDMEVIAEAEDGRITVNATLELMPDVIIMDINMPNLNGIEATRQITTRAQGVKVVALSMHSDRRFITEMLKAGASGYLLKDCALEELAHAINTVIANQIYLSPQITGIVISDVFGNRAIPGSSPPSTLTDREREVLQLIAEGKNTKEIAYSLNVSVKTIETHRMHIMQKLNIRSIAELTKYAIREGLTFLEV